VPALFAAAIGGAFATAHIAGQLGAGVLARHRLVLDHRGAALYLTTAR
jgi:hypothetical protein